MRRPDVGDDLADRAAAIGPGAVVDEGADRHVELADAVDAAGGVELGAERDLEEAVDDLRVGERLGSRRRGAR